MPGEKNPVKGRGAIAAEVIENYPVAPSEGSDRALVYAEATGGPAPIRAADEAAARVAPDLGTARGEDRVQGFAVGDLILEGELADPPAPVGENHRKGGCLAVIAQRLLDQRDPNRGRQRPLTDDDRAPSRVQRSLKGGEQALAADFELQGGRAAVHGAGRGYLAGQRRDRPGSPRAFR